MYQLKSWVYLSCKSERLGNEVKKIKRQDRTRQLSFQTDDEIWIAGSLKEFGKLIGAIEDEKDKLLDRSYEQVRVHLLLQILSFDKSNLYDLKNN